MRRGEDEHRRRAPEGATGRVVELGCAEGVNFPLYPTTVQEVVAVEPEPRFRDGARSPAADAPVPVRVEPGTADALPLEDTSADVVLASLVLCTRGCPISSGWLAGLASASRPSRQQAHAEMPRGGTRPARSGSGFC